MTGQFCSKLPKTNGNRWLAGTLRRFENGGLTIGDRGNSIEREFTVWPMSARICAAPAFQSKPPTRMENFACRLEEPFSLPRKRFWIKRARDKNVCGNAAPVTERDRSPVAALTKAASQSLRAGTWS